MSGLVPSAEQEVSVTRHRIGLVMFCLPLVCSFLEPYVDTLAPGLRPNSWALQLLGDALLVGSFFVLGGNFCRLFLKRHDLQVPICPKHRTLPFPSSLSAKLNRLLKSLRQPIRCGALH
ncbi:hypothetical protein D3C75_1068090 [compost metagenome]